MTTTVDINAALLKCSFCPATLGATEEQAQDAPHNWSARGGMWRCACCVETSHECDGCDRVTKDREIGLEEGWRFCRESGQRHCDVCLAKEEAEFEAEFGWMRSRVRENRQLHKDGEHEAARAVARACGVIDTSED